jgi:hypothetical protein
MPPEDGPRPSWWASFMRPARPSRWLAPVLRFDSDGLVVDQVDYWVQGALAYRPIPRLGE